MENRTLHPDWPRRQVELTIAGVHLRLVAPENPYGLLDLPAVEQAFDEDAYMPYWAHLWPASLMLADWLIGQTRSGSGVAPGVPQPPAAVLEIGCGLGTTGLAAAAVGYTVTLSDYDLDALEYVRASAALNSLKVATCPLDWRQPPGRRFDLVLAADVLYEQRNHQPVLDLFRDTLAPAGLAVVADPCRRVADPFLGAARSAGWAVQTLSARWEGNAGRLMLLRRP